MTDSETRTSQPPQPSRQPSWQLRIHPDGTLALETEGLNPPLTVTGDTLASLRRQTREIKRVSE